MSDYEILREAYPEAGQEELCHILNDIRGDAATSMSDAWRDEQEQTGICPFCGKSHDLDNPDWFAECAGYDEAYNQTCEELAIEYVVNHPN